MVTGGLVFNSVYYSFSRPNNKHSFNIFFNIFFNKYSRLFVCIFIPKIYLNHVFQ